MRVEQEAREVVDAYTASVRLQLYSQLAFLLGAVGFVGVVGGIALGSLSVGVGIPALAVTAILATATAGTLYDQSLRTRLTAASLERTVNTSDDLYAAVPIASQRAKTISLIVTAICSILVAGILAISYSNADTVRDDDDRTEVETPDKPGDDGKDDD